MNRIRLQTGTSSRMIVAGLLVTVILGVDVAVLLRRPVRVGVVTTSGEGESAEGSAIILREAAGITCTTIKALELRDWNVCARFDVLIFPGGRVSRQTEELGPAGRDNVRRFVAEGGGYIGICAGAYLALCEYKNSLGIIRASAREIERHHIEGWGRVSSEGRGALLDISFTDQGALSFEMPQHTLSMAYAGGPLFSLAVEKLDQSVPPSVPVVLATYISEPSGFECQKRTIAGTPAIISGKYGKGTVIAMSPHPDLVTGAEQVLIRSVRFASRK